MLSFIGLVLAVIDFTGLTDVVEAKLDWLRLRLQDMADWIARNLIGRFSRELETWAAGKALIYVKVVLAALYLWGLWMFGSIFLDYVVLFPEASSMGYHVVLLLLLLLSFSGAMMLPGAILALWLGTYMLWGVFHVLNMPRKGIVGSLGIVVAAAGLYWR